MPGQRRPKVFRFGALAIDGKQDLQLWAWDVLPCELAYATAPTVACSGRLIQEHYGQGLGLCRHLQNAAVLYELMKHVSRQQSACEYPAGTGGSIGVAVHQR